jgi:hypothetical protein
MLGQMPRRDRKIDPRGVCAAAIAAAFLLLLLPPGVRPTAAAISSSSVQLKLVTQRPWLSPKGRLGLRLRLNNTGTQDLDGFLLRVGVYDRTTSRSDLHVSFGGTPQVPASAFSKYFPTTRVDAGRSISAVLNERVANLLSLRIATEGGVFPLTIYLYDADGAQLLDSLTTSVIYYPELPHVPLNVVIVVPMNALPAEGPDGVFPPDSSGQYPLAVALSPEGWLTEILTALEEATAPARRGRKSPQHDRDRGDSEPSPLGLALAPSPRLLAEVAHLASGYRIERGGHVQHMGARSQTALRASAFLRRFRALVSSPRVQTMLMPYSFPDLPTLDRNLDLEHLARQLKTAQDVLQVTVGAHASWLLAPEGRLDAPTLDDLRLTGAASHAIVSRATLEQPADPAEEGCPSSFATFACPIRMRSEANTAIGFEADEGLAHRLAALERPGDDALDIQRFLAETAMIQAETPGVTGRTVEATTPPLWHPRPQTAELLFGYMRSAPWLRASTPRQALGVGRELVTKRLVPAAPRVATEPPTSYFTQLSSAEAQVEHYASTLSAAAHPPRLLERLSRDILVAQSRLWWGDAALQTQGTAYANVARSEATTQLHKVSLGGVDEISMTSRRAEIPFVLSSRADHPITVNIDLFSPKLGFDRSKLTGIIVRHGTQQIAVEATARASGIFPVEVSLETSDGYVIAKKSIQIRSTNFNQIALSLTLGALVFLIIFYAGGAVRKRRDRPTKRPTGTSPA